MPPNRDLDMLAPLGTLVFLVSLWLIVALAAEMFSEKGSRILAALRGEPGRDPLPLVTMRRPVRAACNARQPIRARPRLRAAA